MWCLGSYELQPVKDERERRRVDRKVRERERVSEEKNGEDFSVRLPVLHLTSYFLISFFSCFNLIQLYFRPFFYSSLVFLESFV